MQSMTNTDTRDAEATLRQVRELEDAGCEIVRVAVPDRESVGSLERIIEGAGIPVVADVHFDYRLAVESIKTGAAGVRINPGTIGNRSRVERIAGEAARTGTAVRVGVNAGSLESRLRGTGRASAEDLARSALEGAAMLEEHGVDNIKISVKASDVPRTLDAYRIVSGRSDWPLHLGVTEAGTVFSGTIKSAVGIGALLAEGIGDTIRVSLTASPVEEVRVGRRILASLGLRKGGPQVISCPTCARAEIDVITLAERVERALEGREDCITVAVMGCPVNGPGEAREADVGIAGGKEGGLLFSRGVMVRRVPPDRLYEELLAEVEKMLDESKQVGN